MTLSIDHKQELLTALLLKNHHNAIWLRLILDDIFHNKLPLELLKFIPSINQYFNYDMLTHDLDQVTVPILRSIWDTYIPFYRLVQPPLNYCHTNLLLSMIRSANLPCVQFLWNEVTGVKWKLCDSRGWNALHYAAFSKNTDMISWCNQTFDSKMQTEKILRGTMKGLTPDELYQKRSTCVVCEEDDLDSSFAAADLNSFLTICTNIDLVREFIDHHFEIISRTFPKHPKFCESAYNSIVIGGAEAFRSLFRRKIFPYVIN